MKRENSRFFLKIKVLGNKIRPKLATELRGHQDQTQSLKWGTAGNWKSVEIGFVMIE